MITMKTQSDADGPNGRCARGQILFCDLSGKLVGSLDSHKELPDTIKYRGAVYQYSGVVDGQGIYTLAAEKGDA